MFCDMLREDKCADENAGEIVTVKNRRSNSYSKLPVFAKHLDGDFFWDFASIGGVHAAGQ